jgi:hypothetical protein
VVKDIKKDKIHGFIPPPHFEFKNAAEAIGFLVAGLCSQECSRFLEYVARHPKKNDLSVGRFLSAYALINWACGDIDESVWGGREVGAKRSLTTWAKTMIELNTWFREHDVDDPIEFIRGRSLIKRSAGVNGWEPNHLEIERLLHITLGPEEISKFLK